MAAYIVILGTKNYTGMIFAMVLATLGEMLIDLRFRYFCLIMAALERPFTSDLWGNWRSRTGAGTLYHGKTI